MGAIVASLWFLSAMFVVFPLYCWLLTRKKHLFIACEVFYVPVIYYGAFGFLRTAEYPYSLLRALSGLCVGTLVYYCKNYLNTTGHGNCKNSLVNVLIIVCLFMSLWGLNFSLTRLVFLLFFIGMSLLFSEKSSISFSSNVIDGLGKISGYVFLIHWTVGSSPEISSQMILCPSAFVRVSLQMKISHSPFSPAKYENLSARRLTISGVSASR